MMREWTSQDYRAEIDSRGLLRVFKLTSRELRKTNISPQGHIKVSFENEDTAADPLDKKLLKAMNALPVFAAGYAGGSEWHCDIDVGFQRFLGVKHSRDINKALENCGFDVKTRQKIMAVCRGYRWHYCPRQAS